MIANTNKRLTNDIIRRIQNICRDSEEAEATKRLYNEAEWARKHHNRIQQLQDIDNEVGGEEEIEEDDQEIPTVQEETTSYALTLDVSGTSARNLRPSRNGVGNIELHNRKQFSGEARMLIVASACTAMGYSDDKTWGERKRIALAACTMVAYDLGYRKVIGTRQVHEWIKQINKSARVNGTMNVLQNKHKGSTSYMDRVDANDPTYLFSLYRYATGLLGDSATFDEIADVMTQKSAAEQEHETININRLQLLRWFHKKGGKAGKVMH